MALSAGRPSQKLPPKTLASLRNEDKARLNIEIDRDFYRRVKQRALDENTTVTEITLKALAQYLGE
jgi:hypothetical protein